MTSTMRPPSPDDLREEMKRLVRRAAEPARVGESVKAEIGRAARRLGLGYGRVKRYWYGEIAVPPAHEVDAIRAAVARRERPTATVSKPAGLAAQIHVIYDENGRVWAADSPELRDSLGYTVGDFDVGGFAVRCLGWVEVRHTPGRMHVRIAPRVVQPKALDALFNALATAPKVEVVLAVRADQAWEEATYPSAIAAAERIEVLVRGPAADSGRRFVAVRQSPSVLFRDKQRYLIGMLQEARTLAGIADLSAVVRFAAADTTGRTSVAVSAAARGVRGAQWSWEHIASAIRFYTAEERQRLVGSDVRNAPDTEYGEWCAEAYDRAIAAGEPIIEDVRALVFRRTGSPLESRYRRVLIPFAIDAGRSIVLVTSDFKPLLRAA
jgi:hypothetical protein